jgi:hypothetical protein
MSRAEFCLAGAMVDERWKQPSNRTVADYLDQSSPARKQLSKASAAREGQGWERLSARQCRGMYLGCSGGLGLLDYGDVVVVLQNGLTEEMFAGWTRDKVFPSMSDEDRTFWDDVVPADKVNSLFYTSECRMNLDFYLTDDGANMCQNTCAPRLSLPTSAEEKKPTLQVLPDIEGNESNEWEYRTMTSMDVGAWEFQMRSGLNSDYKDHAYLNVAYCMAERVDLEANVASDASSDHLQGIPGGLCQVSASNLIVFVIILCVLAKTVQCCLVTNRLAFVDQRHPPLMTIGDAVDSLLRNPDPTTEWMCTLEQADLKGSAPHFIPSLSTTVNPQSLQAGARRWEGRDRKYFTAIGLTSWLLTYGLFLCILGAGVAAYVVSTNRMKIP